MGKSLRFLVCQFCFFKLIWDAYSYHSKYVSHVYLGRLVTWVNVGGGCYKVVLEPSSTLGPDGKNVFFIHACRLYNCLLCMHCGGHCYSCVDM